MKKGQTWWSSFKLKVYPSACTLVSGLLNFWKFLALEMNYIFPFPLELHINGSQFCPWADMRGKSLEKVLYTSTKSQKKVKKSNKSKKKFWKSQKFLEWADWRSKIYGRWAFSSGESQNESLKKVKEKSKKFHHTPTVTNRVVITMEMGKMFVLFVNSIIAIIIPTLPPSSQIQPSFTHKAFNIHTLKNQHF